VNAAYSTSLYPVKEAMDNDNISRVMRAKEKQDAHEPMHFSMKGKIQ
jgi:hypothetical protein